ncbi:MAG: hypothetical protein ACLFVX_05490 [Archaeoglobaceae archaeon]
MGKKVFEKLKAVYRPSEDIFEVIAKVPEDREIEIETQPSFHPHETEKFRHSADKDGYEIRHFLFEAYGVERATFTVRCEGVEKKVTIERQEHLNRLP